MIALTSNFILLLAVFLAAGSPIVTLSNALTVAVNRVQSLAVDASVPKITGVNVGTKVIRAGMWGREQPGDAERGAREPLQHRSLGSRLLDLPLPQQLKLGRLGRAMAHGLLDDSKRSINSRIAGRAPSPVRQQAASSAYTPRKPQAVFASRIIGHRSYTVEKDETNEQGKDTIGSGKSLDDFTYGDDMSPDDGSDNAKSAQRVDNVISGSFNDEGDSVFPTHDDDDDDQYEDGGFERRDTATVNSTVPLVNSTTSPTLMVASTNATNGTFVVHPFVGTVLVHPDNSTSQHFARDLNSSRVLGTVDIMSDMYNSTDGNRLASLVLINSTSGYQLDADSHKHTAMYLVIAPPNPAIDQAVSAIESPSEVPVRVEMDVFSQQQQAIESWCATYNASLTGMTHISVEPCRDDGLDKENKSQTFLWNKQTSALRPMFWVGKDDGTSTIVRPLSAEAAGKNMSLPSVNTTSPASTLITAASTNNTTATAKNTTAALTSAAPLTSTTALPGVANAERIANAAKAYVSSQGLDEHVQAFQSTYSATSSHPPLGARDTAEPVTQNVTLVFHPNAPSVASVDGSYEDPETGKVGVSASLVDKTSSMLPTATGFNAAAVTSLPTTSILSDSSAPASVSAGLSSVASGVKIADVVTVTPTWTIAASPSSASVVTTASSSASGMRVTDESSLSASGTSSSTSSASTGTISSSAALKVAEVSSSATLTSTTTSTSATASNFKVAEVSSSAVSSVASASSSASASASSFAGFKASGTSSSVVSSSASVSATTSASATDIRVAEASSTATSSSASSPASSSSSVSGSSIRPVYHVAGATLPALVTPSVFVSQVVSATTAAVVSSAIKVADVTSSASSSATSSSAVSSSSMMVLGVASASASSSSASATVSTSSAAVSATKIAARDIPRMTPVDFAPYKLQFSRDEA